MHVISTKFFSLFPLFVMKIAQSKQRIPSCNMFRVSSKFFSAFSIVVLFAFFFVGTAAFAKAPTSLPARPHNSYVYDENHLMSTQEIRQFNIISEELYRKTGAAIACVLMNDIGNVDYRTFAVKTAEKWGVGGKSNEGILIFASIMQRRRSVEIGYGAEGYLPDALVEKIQRKTIVPAFKQQKYGQGVVSLAYALAVTTAKAKGVTLELNEKEFVEEQQETPASMILFILFIFFLLVMSKSSGGRGNGCLWFLLGNAIGSSSHRGPRGGFGGGFGGGRGGFGGGFGGGRFGGGGSGGSW